MSFDTARPPACPYSTDELDLLLGPDYLEADQTRAVFRAIVTRSGLSP
jgi:hypothetical protein